MIYQHNRNLHLDQFAGNFKIPRIDPTIITMVVVFVLMSVHLIITDFNAENSNGAIMNLIAIPTLIWIMKDIYARPSQTPRLPFAAYEPKKRRRKSVYDRVCKKQQLIK